MKDLFICLLLNLKNHGNIISATLHKSGTFASIDLEGDDVVYTISIRKEEKKEEVKNDD